MLMTSSLSQPMAPMHRISARRMSMPALWCFASSCAAQQAQQRSAARMLCCLTAWQQLTARRVTISLRCGNGNRSRLRCRSDHIVGL
jgi:hypothetical protein